MTWQKIEDLIVYNIIKANTSESQHDIVTSRALLSNFFDEPEPTRNSDLSFVFLKISMSRFIRTNTQILSSALSERVLKLAKFHYSPGRNRLSDNKINNIIVSAA